MIGENYDLSLFSVEIIAFAVRGENIMKVLYRQILNLYFTVRRQDNNFMKVCNGESIGYDAHLPTWFVALPFSDPEYFFRSIRFIAGAEYTMIVFMFFMDEVVGPGKPLAGDDNPPAGKDIWDVF
jgi:hypothetical protein